MDVLRPFLPQADGFLPYWLLITSMVAIGNCIQTYTTLHYTRRLYPGQFVPNAHLPPRTATFNPEDSVSKLVPAPAGAQAKDKHAADQVTPLAGRLFGTYTTVAAIVRLYAAYNITVAPVYDIAVWTYVVALAHFGSELLVYKSMNFGLPQFFPFLVSTATLICMPLVRSHYVG
jgi:hypothetical protein